MNNTEANRVSALATLFSGLFVVCTATVLTVGPPAMTGLLRPLEMLIQHAATPAPPPAQRWASPLLLKETDRPESPEISAGQANSDTTPTLTVAYTAMGALLVFSLLESLLFAIIQTGVLGLRARVAFGSEGAGAGASGPAAPVDYEAKCQQLYQTVSALWAWAETAVFDLDEALPLRSLLFKELRHISRRLALDSDFRLGVAGALTVQHDKPYWRLLSQRLNQSARDLNRIATVAEAASAGFGDRNSEPRIPKSRDEACFILGANREADLETLQRLVKALRQCWHPDLAQTDQDRTYREARIKQINAAHDLITGKRAEG